MYGYIRTQQDGQGDRVSEETGTIFDPDDNRARQEFRDDADINKLLARHGVTAVLNQREGVYGEVNYDLDLQGAYTAQREASDAYGALPAEVREKYPTWEDVLAAANRGEVVMKDGKAALAETEEKPENVEPPSDNPK